MRTIREILMILEARPNPASHINHKLCRHCEAILQPGATAYFNSQNNAFCTQRCAEEHILALEALMREIELQELPPRPPRRACGGVKITLSATRRPKGWLSRMLGRSS